MAKNKMLIDAAHSEETRVAVVRGNRVEEFDFESEHKKQIRGNIYLAKVTRVEPSLQAAFVDYGGNRHGFLAFNEIHPDYYQIPVADRQALLEEEAEDALADKHAEESGDEEEAAPKKRRSRRSSRKSKDEDKSSDRDDSADEEDASDADEQTDTTAENADESVESNDASDTDPVADDTDEESDSSEEIQAADNESDDVVSEEAEKPKRRRTSRTRKKKVDEASVEEENTTAKAEAAPAEIAESDSEETAEEKPKRVRRTRRKKAEKPAGETEAADGSAESAQAGEPEAEAASEEAQTAKPKRRTRRSRSKKYSEETAPEADEQETSSASDEDAGASDERDEDDEREKKPAGRRGRRSRSRSRPSADDNGGDENGEDDDADESVEEVGSEDALEEVPVRRSNRRNYKIQEVIKRRQVMLVQVVKEERGNKGAALTTYLSLAGRYSVLMPNTARGGGISRKITNTSDRKRLKTIANELDVPNGMGVILRTAGASQTQADIQRDFEYLLRLWENVRTLTLESSAPCLVYEEGSLIKRSIRDLYDKNTDEVIVAGEAGYKEAREFMAMLMPGHEGNIKAYRDRIPMFAKLSVEAQLDAMLQPQVTLKSGGYLVINQTEALVAIDVNSGKATRQHSVEETALATNLEAAEEVARQLRLRDLAGLIVIDFIDMEERRNNRSVEKRLKEALKNDRARIQVGRISHFGLMEMSRQRMRASVLESTTQICPTCEGHGFVRAPASVVLGVLRTIEENLNRNRQFNLIVRVRAQSAIYLLNNKRENLTDLEERFGVSIAIEIDETIGSEQCVIARGDHARRRMPGESAVQVDTIAPEEVGEAEEAPSPSPEPVDTSDDEDRPRRRRRRKKSGNEDEGVDKSSDENTNQESKTETPEADVSSSDQPIAAQEPEAEFEERGRRTRRPRQTKRETATETAAPVEITEAVASESAVEQQTAPPVDEPPRRPRRSTSRPGKVDLEAREEPVEQATTADVDDDQAEPVQVAAAKAASETVSEPPRRPRRPTSRPGKKDQDINEAAPELEEPKEAAAEEEEIKPKKKPRRKTKKTESEDASVSEEEEAPAKPKRARRPRKKPEENAEESSEDVAETSSEPSEKPVAEAEASDEDNADKGPAESDSEEDAGGKREGWWKRRFF